MNTILYIQHGWIWTSDTGGRKHKHSVYKNLRAGEIFSKISTLQKPTFPNISKKLLNHFFRESYRVYIPKEMPPPLPTTHKSSFPKFPKFISPPLHFSHHPINHVFLAAAPFFGIPFCVRSRLLSSGAAKEVDRKWGNSVLCAECGKNAFTYSMYGELYRLLSPRNVWWQIFTLTIIPIIGWMSYV